MKRTPFLGGIDLLCILFVRTCYSWLLVIVVHIFVKNVASGSASPFSGTAQKATYLRKSVLNGFASKRIIFGRRRTVLWQTV